jgi:hypothetical protein
LLKVAEINTLTARNKAEAVFWTRDRAHPGVKNVPIERWRADADGSEGYENCLTIGNAATGS